jgi:hypothetical protein
MQPYSYQIIRIYTYICTRNQLLICNGNMFKIDYIYIHVRAQSITHLYIYVTWLYLARGNCHGVLASWINFHAILADEIVIGRVKHCLSLTLTKLGSSKCIGILAGISCVLGQ